MGFAGFVCENTIGTRCFGNVAGMNGWKLLWAAKVLLKTTEDATLHTEVSMVYVLTAKAQNTIIFGFTSTLFFSSMGLISFCAIFLSCAKGNKRHRMNKSIVSSTVAKGFIDAAFVTHCHI